MAKFNIEMPEEQRDEVRLLVAACGFEDEKELLNNSLTLFQWAVTQISTGRKICSLEERTGEIKTLEMEFMGKISQVG